MKRKAIKVKNPYEIKSKGLIKYATYLTPEMVKSIKLKAIDEGKNDYEIVGEALKKYL